MRKIESNTGVEEEATSNANATAGPLADIVAFQLRIAQAASFQAFAELTGDQGLRPGHYAVLQVIAAHPGISQTELSRAVGRDKTTLTPTLHDMERGGLIKRDPHPEDRRSRMLSLTPQGEEKLAALVKCANEHDQRIDKILGARDRQILLRTLKKLIAGLEDTSNP